MKKTFTFLFSILLCCNLLAQQTVADEYQYVPIADNAEWSVNWEKFRTHGDTVINGKNYLKVYYQSAGEPFNFDFSKAIYCCALRNDTLQKRVYGVPKVSYESEYLIYDFSLQIGDTVTVTSIICAYGDLRHYTVKRVDKIWDGRLGTHELYDSDSLIMLNDNSLRKRILVEAAYPYHDEFALTSSWIEGVGSTRGLLSHTSTHYLEVDIPYNNLLCYAENDELLYFTEFDPDDNPDDCYSGGTGGNIKENERSSFRLYPNPSGQIIRIEPVENMNFGDCRIELIDLLGKQIYSTLFNDYMELDVSTYPNGFYYVKIVQQNKPLFYGKVIIQK